MVKYCYYDPGTKQVMSVYETPELSDQMGEEGRQLAIILDGMEVGRNHKIDSVDTLIVAGLEVVDEFSVSINPKQPTPDPRKPVDDLHDKLANDTITDVEIREMLRLERGL